jgi:hypothetical protein
VPAAVIERLLEQGAVRTPLRASPTVQASGTRRFSPERACNGIIGNQWWDRAEGKAVTSVSDDKVWLLGGNGSAEGSSPARLLVSTVGDELKNSGKGGKVIGISLKDRSAILPGGKKADAAYWFDWQSGNFVSSTYYFPELPAWVREFNAARPADRLGRVGSGTDARRSRQELYVPWTPTPYSDEMLQALALRALAAENLTRDQDRPAGHQLLRSIREPRG